MKPFSTNMAPASLCLLAALAGPASAAPAEGVPGATLESLLQVARHQNPEFATARHEAQAAAERVYPAGALPDPILRTELQDITNQGTDSAPNILPGRIGSTKYTLIQALPFWGKRELKRAVAQAEADQAKARTSATWADLAARIKSAFADYFVLTQSLELSRELQAIAGSLEKIARARYANGLVPQQDVIRAQLEQTTISADLVEIENEQHHAMVKINTLLKRPAAAPLATPVALAALPDPAKLDPAALEQRLRDRNPEVFSEEARVLAAEKNRELAYRNRYPDFNLGLSPIQAGSRISEWGVMVELNIPLQQQTRRSQEREAQALVDAAEARRDATRIRLFADLAEKLSGLETARRLDDLARNSLLPQSELGFKAALAGYQTGKVDFATVLDSQRQIRKARLDALKAQGQAQQRLAEIERLLGEDL